VPRESGIIVPVAEAEATVGDFRLRYDAGARLGIPAHITLLYPFAHPSRVDDEIDGLDDLFKKTPTFDFSLIAVRRFAATAYLHPEPAAPFIRVMEALIQRWPEFPPYGGAYAGNIPHLTVADQVPEDVMDLVAAALANALPIRCRAKEAWLMCSDERDVWSRHGVFPFGVPMSA